MDLTDVMAGAEMIHVNEAAPLLGRTPNTVYRQLRSKQLVGRQWGRDWMIPILRDEEGRAVFLFRGEGDK